MSKFTIHCLRLAKREPIVDSKTQAVIDDGVNRQMQLGSFDDEKIANMFMKNVKANTHHKTFKIWME